MALHTPTNRFTCKYGSCPLLGSSNYAEWNLSVQMLLRGAHALGLVDRTEAAPTSGANALRNYAKGKETAVSLLWNTLTPSTQQVVAITAEPNEMWTILKQRLDVTLNTITAARIRWQFNVEKWTEKDTISSWYFRLLTYQNKLNGSKRALSDEDLAMTLLMGLPSNLSTVRQKIIDSQPDLNLDSVINALESNIDVVAQGAVRTANGTGNTEALIALQGLQEK